MKRFMAIAALALVLDSCCQSIWFTVEKGNPEERTWLPIPEVALPPIRKPTYVANRFDVLAGGQPTVLFPHFADELMRGENPVEAFGQALDELAAMQGAYGTQNNAPPLDLLKSESEPVNAVVSCEDDLHSKGCKFLTIAAPFHVDRPLFARVTTKGATYVRTVVSCSEGIGESAVDKTPCTSQQNGSLVTLADSVPARAKEPVVVTFSVNDRDASSVELSETAFTFVHLSDVQLRDPTVTLTDPDLSHRLDMLIPSFEYDYDQAFYGRYVVESLFATINAEASRYAKGDPRRPAFVLHTGDSIDSGVRSELVEFHGLVDELEIPFYNALGNHDLLVFGNLLPTSTRDSDTTCVDAGSLAAHYVHYFHKKRRILPNRLCVDQKIKCKHCADGEAVFVAQPDIEQSRRQFIAGFAHRKTVAVTQPAAPSSAGGCPSLVPVQPLSFKHGLDLNEGKGHYAFAQEIEIAKQKRRIIMVVLDSEDLPPNTGGAGGFVGARQISWLRSVLECAEVNDLVFVFSHHSMGDLRTAKSGKCSKTIGTETTQYDCNEVESILAVDKHVVAHFYGHNHLHGLCRDGRATTCSNFWEVETGAMIEFPQEARLVRLKYAGAGLAYLDITAFSERLQPEQNELATAVARGRRGAERDYCHTHSEAKCSPDLHVQRQDGRHTNARLFFRLPESR